NPPRGVETTVSVMPTTGANVATNVGSDAAGKLADLGALRGVTPAMLAATPAILAGQAAGAPAQAGVTADGVMPANLPTQTAAATPTRDGKPGDRDDDAPSNGDAKPLKLDLGALPHALKHAAHGERFALGDLAAAKPDAPMSAAERLAIMQKVVDRAT